MQNLDRGSSSVPDLISQYEHHLSARGLASNTRALHRHVTQSLFCFCFPAGQITWNDFQFSDCVGFLKKEFARLPSRETRKVWLMVLRSVFRYLAEESYIAGGWEAALPKIASYSYASLPRRL